MVAPEEVLVARSRRGKSVEQEDAVSDDLDTIGARNVSLPRENVGGGGGSSREH
jgi:hypothetical protein